MAVCPAFDPSLMHAADAADVLEKSASSADGLTSTEAAVRLASCGRNRLEVRREQAVWQTFAAQFKSPLVLILVFAAVVSMVTGEWVDALIVLAIIFASSVLGFVQEYRAEKATQRLLARIRLRANVMRDGHTQLVDAETLVPGDVVLLAAGSLVPADARVLAADDFFVNEAVLTGEPAERKTTRNTRSQHQSRAPHQLCLHGYQCAQRHCTRVSRCNGFRHGLWTDRSASLDTADGN